ncbi:Uma2 family endonuclease [Gloeobacter morelensis MG652769]|uniref:Uma2 family endonuclease n=2 Tax=Gloeobacter TaxID=33071 RepID=A0ABY3PL86_9CYAN|nr:Uma2 family endonuclease [Gloeobacter morelensis MG652769]
MWIMFATLPPLGICPRLFTVDEYYRMGKAGISRPDERVELIDGMVVNMPPQGPMHAATVRRILACLSAVHRVGGSDCPGRQAPRHRRARRACTGCDRRGAGS